MLLHWFSIVILLFDKNIISILNHKFNIEIKDLNIENISKLDSEKLYKASENK